MEKEIVLGIIGLILGFFLFRYIIKHQKRTEDIYSEILHNKKYKVKGQWDKE